MRVLFAAALLLLAAACSSPSQAPGAPDTAVDAAATPADAPADAAADLPLVGGDVDEHGCRGSAGYAWCAHTAQCERPWELAGREGFENSEAGFAAYCAAPAVE
ncbi:hypothetical protein LDO26_17445 [Luteimonas sp. BDR2-5]|uniref:hypothetical protein n=1 Tax=Proluteimonas luteida TaxID=2878685 RepID=UPI001E3B91BD|nr:hypothetical protein [Luteimonas sp. BDR2-5]MCD9029978.1 hypothetical protein [Luteimonas sp. BDR2-5]